jgi:DNA-binding MarR family transcriptional regulator
VQAIAATTQVTSAELAQELQLFWAELMRGSGPDVVRELEQLDLSITQMKVLHILADSDGELSIKQLGTCTAMSLPGASRTADGLLRRKYVERREDTEDRRIKRLKITPLGRSALQRLEAARLAGIERYGETLTPEQRSALHDALRALPHRLQAEKDLAL